MGYGGYEDGEAHWIVGCGSYEDGEAHWIVACAIYEDGEAHWIVGCGSYEDDESHWIVGYGGYEDGEAHWIVRCWAHLILWMLLLLCFGHTRHNSVALVWHVVPSHSPLAIVYLRSLKSLQ